MIINGTFTSNWDCCVIRTKATLDTETGEIDAETADVDINGDQVLESETFTDKDDNEYPVCLECHRYITKKAMVKGVGHALEEVEQCMDPNCESNMSPNDYS